MPEVKKIYMSTREVAEALEVSTATVRDWIRKGFLPAFQPPSPLAQANSPGRGMRGMHRIKREDFEEFVKKGQRPYKIHEH